MIREFDLDVGFTDYLLFIDDEDISTKNYKIPRTKVLRSTTKLPPKRTLEA